MHHTLSQPERRAMDSFLPSRRLRLAKKPVKLFGRTFQVPKLKVCRKIMMLVEVLPEPRAEPAVAELEPEPELEPEVQVEAEVEAKAGAEQPTAKKTVRFDLGKPSRSGRTMWKQVLESLCSAPVLIIIFLVGLLLLQTVIRPPCSSVDRAIVASPALVSAPPSFPFSTLSTACFDKPTPWTMSTTTRLPIESVRQEIAKALYEGRQSPTAMIRDHLDIQQEVLTLLTEVECLLSAVQNRSRFHI